ncbi:MAG: O-antigen ligase family protein [bacterium]
MISTRLNSLFAPDLVIELALVLLLVFTPLPKGTFSGWPVLVVHALSFVMLINWIIKMRGQRSRPVHKTPIDFPLIFFFIFALLSCIFSLDHTKSISGVLKVLDCIIIFYVAQDTLNTRRKIKIILYAAILTGSFLSLLGLIQLLDGIDHSFWVLPVELSATFENSNYFAGYMALIIPLTIGILFDELEPGQRIMVFYLLIMMILAFILSLSRGGWISLTVALGAMSFLFFGKSGVNKELVNRKLLILLPFLLAVIFMLAICLGFTSILGKMDSRNFHGRIELWKQSVGIIRDYPFFGAGVDVFTSFHSAIPAGYKSIDRDYMRSIKKWMLSKYNGYDGLELCNQYLQTAAEMGIPGFFCLLWLIVEGISGSVKVYNRKKSRFEQMVSLSIIGGEMATIVHMLSSNLLNFLSISVLLSVLIGIIFAEHSLTANAHPASLEN